MKRLQRLLLALLTFCVAPSTHATLLSYEGVDYPPSPSINQRAGGLGWNGGWSGNDNVVAGSLALNGVAASGGRIVTDGGNTGSFRILATAGRAALLHRGKFGKDDTTLWLSFLFQPETTAPNNYAGLSLYDGAESQQLYVGVPTGQSRIALFSPSVGGATIPTTAVGTNRQTFFLVVKLVFGSGFTDRAFLWVNPPLDQAPPENTRDALLSNMGIQFDRILVSSGTGATTASFDEIRMGETFQDVAPLAESRLEYSQLRRFGNTNEMAAAPTSGLVEGSDGALFGASYYGGIDGVGTLFKLNKDGSGYRVIWNFLGDTNGQFPNRIIRGTDGLLYGTTGNRASGVTAATVYKISEEGTGFTVLYRFGGFRDGLQPAAGLLEGSDGFLYGTTQYGGSNNLGTVYTLGKNGTGYRILRHFVASEGNYPQAALVEASDGALYGTAFGNNNGGQGTVFRLNKDGSGYTNVHSFVPGPLDGGSPQAGLLLGKDGMLYGTTSLGGNPGAGTVYRLNPDGSGFKVVHSFGPGQVGANPRNANLLEGDDGALYGSIADGSVFRLNKDGSQFAMLHRFGSVFADGRAAVAQLIQASDRRLYGITAGGGVFGNQAQPALLQGGEGTVFTLKTDGAEYAVLRSFSSSGADAWDPQAGLIRGSDGAFYGTSTKGGAEGVGTVFRVNADGQSFAILRNFSNKNGDGQFPTASLLEGSDGSFYGTTSAGGAGGQGTVYRLGKNGEGYTVLVQGGLGYPQSRLIEGRDGLLYGTGQSLIFKLNKNGTGFASVKTFASIPLNLPDGNSLRSPVLQASDGALYGTTTSGAANGVGTLFRINPEGTGFRVLRTFSRRADDVSGCYGGLIEGVDGLLYGTSQETGPTTQSSVFKIAKDGSGFRIIGSLPGDSHSPLLPRAGGMLYGTTVGTLGNDSGWIFRVSTTGTAFELLYKFRGTGRDGQLPRGGLTPGVDGALYGTTEAGGYTLGTVYRFGPPPITTPQNRSPLLTNPMPDQYAPTGTAYAYTFAADTFTEPDALQSLSLSMDGLPPGISFIASTRTMSGTPTQNGSYLVALLAVDSGTPPASAMATFKFIVAPTPPVEQNLTKVVQLGGPSQGSGGIVEGRDDVLYGWDRGSDAQRRGSLFRVGKNGSGLKTLHAFAGTAEGGDTPFDLIQGSDRLLYGVTVDAQARTIGRLFSVSTNGTDYRVVRRWDMVPGERASPFSLMEGSDCALYGVGQPSGTLGSAKLWKLHKDGTGYQVLHDFESDIPTPNIVFGDYPTGGVVEGQDGSLFGFATGGTANLGIVYRIHRDGSGYEIIHEFTGSENGGGFPSGKLRFASDGYAYGVASRGGIRNQPVVFRMRPGGADFSVLLSGAVAGADAGNALAESDQGYFYGTTAGGGQYVSGSIYRFMRDGSSFEVLHDFSLQATPPLGIQPSPALHGRDGFLYMVTQQQTSFSVTQPAWQLLIVKFGPVPVAPVGSRPLILNPTLALAGTELQFRLSFIGEPGRTYEIQSVEAISSVWMSQQRIVADAQGSVVYTDANPSARAVRFFRVLAD